MHALYRAGLCGASPTTCRRACAFDRKLYVARRVFEQSNDNTYVVSLLQPHHCLQGHVPGGPAAHSSIQTSRTRTMSRPLPWSTPGSPPTPTPAGSGRIPTALSLHNGEINTIRGNVDRMLAREETMSSDCWAPTSGQGVPGGQRRPARDSAMLDNTLEFLVMSGMDLPLAVMVCIPEPWSNDETISPRQAGSLPVLRHHDGAVGRPGLHPVFRR